MLSIIRDNNSLFDALPCGVAVFHTSGNYDIAYSNKIYNAMFPKDRLYLHDEDASLFSQTLKHIYSPRNRIFRIKNILGSFVRARIFIVEVMDDTALAVVYDDNETYYELKNLKNECDRYSMAISGTDGIFFEYNRFRDTGIVFYAAPNGEIITKYVSNWIRGIENLEYIFSEDIEIIQKILNNEIKEDVKTDIRLRLPGLKDFEWFSIILRPGSHKNFIVGSARNINDIKLNEEELKKNALIDPLSKVYNRAPAIDKIKSILKKHSPSDPPCALIVLDIDNFKHVNDTYGHVYGDAVISMAAGSVKSVVDKEDIIGRFGGDEFFVYIENGKTEFLEKKLTDICQSILKMRLDKNNANDISCSIGVAVNDGIYTYDELFKMADSALYTAKRNGKNRFEYFSGEYIEEGELSYAAKNLNNEGESNTEYNLAAVALEIASKSSNAENAILNIIRHAGVTMNLDFIQIMRFDTIEDSVSIEYQWSKEVNGAYNVVSTDMKKGYYHHNDLLAFGTCFRREKIFKYTNDFKDQLSQKYKDVFEKNPASYVFSSNMENESTFWCLTLQDVNVNRIWTAQEFNDISEITKILSVYLKSMLVVSEREKMLINRLDYDNVGTFSRQKFFDEAGRIGRFARFVGESLAAASFEFPNLHEYTCTCGRKMRDDLVQKFADFLLKANPDKVISSYSFTTTGFISLFSCKPKEDLAEIITDRINEFFADIPGMEESGLIMKVGVCLFPPGAFLADAIDTADYIKRDIKPESGFCACSVTDKIITTPK